jgi:DNA-binding LacI/PurR family transcriptional regulator
VTAVLCGNDDLAVGVIRAMHEAGRAIPGSVSVVGFDDTPHAEFLSPALTTVRLDFVELGRECVRRLWSLVDPALATEPQGPRPEPELIVRESAGPAPGQPGSPPARRRPRSHRSLSGPPSSALSTCHSEGAKRE